MEQNSKWLIYEWKSKAKEEKRTAAIDPFL